MNEADIAWVRGGGSIMRKSEINIPPTTHQSGERDRTPRWNCPDLTRREIGFIGDIKDDSSSPM